MCPSLPGLCGSICSPSSGLGAPTGSSTDVKAFCFQFGSSGRGWAGKKQVGAGCDMSVVSALLGAGALPGGYVRGTPLTCAFGTFSRIRKGTRRAGPDTPHPMPPEGGIPLKKATCCAAAQFS
ncbi:hypothetical protein D1157_12725 [Anaerotruncus sp. X29]|nr:hypothetical protein [Anaerotruncus sp. X29]